MLVSKLRSAYQYYVYSSPIPVLSKEETIIFNAINVSLLLFGLYWSMSILSLLVIKSMESLWYFVTDHSVSANFVLSFIISRNFWIKCGFHDVLTRNKTTTEI
ncbi:Piso0_005409 [Millerozyma farinosa CBS 7064]|uniref:Piso0_005409 protein n=1 Tax=Pichia sorbitophila (strain ATCC MYA-4447 / BCRC 22081 / CBS 7064 / NBRC 10061 / NRRL Y-12695) TaxID=559304 RepID=G8Y511_PICSO|nr:Piso0_005409 [Millerozyma farinosa CBS 7064]